MQCMNIAGWAETLKSLTVDIYVCSHGDLQTLLYKNINEKIQAIKKSVNTW